MTARVCLLAIGLSICPSPCSAESLFDAIQLAYQTNPIMRAQRADSRATDEQLVQAKSAFGPRVTLSGQVGYGAARVELPATKNDFKAGTVSGQLSLVQPIYSSGALSAQVRAAEATVMASRQTLRQAEAQLILNVITAYLDVRRERETMQILQDEIASLSGEFAEIRAKGKLGALTITDVAQAEARLLSAKAELEVAQGRLNTSTAGYLNVVGRYPGDLEPEPELVGLPITVDEALASAEQNNAQLLAALETERATAALIRRAKAASRPTVSFRMDAAISPNEAYLSNQYTKSVSAAAVMSLPLFTSGENSSKVREAKENNTRDQLVSEATMRAVTQLVYQAWGQIESYQSAIAIYEDRLTSQRSSVRGYRVEQRVGQRSTIDLLNAELELANARIGLVQARHDQYIAKANLLSAMGLLEARFQTPSTELYNPAKSFNRIKSRNIAPWASAIAAIDKIGQPSLPRQAKPSPSGIADRAATPANLPYVLSFTSRSVAPWTGATDKMAQPSLPGQAKPSPREVADRAVTLTNLPYVLSF